MKDPIHLGHGIYRFPDGSVYAYRGNGVYKLIDKHPPIDEHGREWKIVCDKKGIPVKLVRK